MLVCSLVFKTSWGSKTALVGSIPTYSRQFKRSVRLERSSLTKIFAKEEIHFPLKAKFSSMSRERASCPSQWQQRLESHLKTLFSSGSHTAVVPIAPALEKNNKLSKGDLA